MFIRLLAAALILTTLLTACAETTTDVASDIEDRDRREQSVRPPKSNETVSGARSLPLFSPPSPILAKQLATVIKEVKFENVPFADAIGKLRELTGMNIFVLWKSLEAVGIDGHTPVSLELRNVTAAEAVSAVLASSSTPNAHTAYEAKDNILWVRSSLDNAQRRTTRLYDLSPLILAERARRLALEAPGGARDETYSLDQITDNITQLLFDTIPLDLTNGSGLGDRVSTLNGRLIVTTNPDNHAQIENLIAALKVTAKHYMQPAAKAPEK